MGARGVEPLESRNMVALVITTMDSPPNNAMNPLVAAARRPRVMASVGTETEP